MPILDARTLEFISHSAAQTQRFGVRLGELLQPGDVLCLSGDLGSGKTTMTVGIGQGWGALQMPTSPTFTLVNEYTRPGDTARLVHIDCYRVADAREALDFGLDDYLDGRSAMVIEWPERIATILPADRLWITLRHFTETKRSLRFEARGLRAEEMLALFRRSAFHA